MSADQLLAAAPDGPLRRYIQPTRALIEAVPTVFRIPARTQESPTGYRDDALRRSARPSLRDHRQGVPETRPSIATVPMTSSITPRSFQDVFSLIYRSEVVICDFSGSNPNVYYEAGIAHTLGRPVVPLTQVQEHVTFDLRHHRFIQYLNNQEGLQDLEPKLESRLSRLFHIPSP